MRVPRTARCARIAAALLATCALAGAGAGSASAANPWLEPDQFLNMAHQGGELEAPGNTLYAFKTPMRDGGADSLEMDSYITEDGHLVINHDATLGDTTNFGTPAAPPPFDAPGASPYIWDYTLAELKQLDAAYWFAPGTGEYDHSNPNRRFRGVATGDVPPPPGYNANDFRIPTFQEVLAAFPDTRINIDLKYQSAFPDKSIEAAHALAQILKGQPGGDNENVLVASFGQGPMEAFHADLPSHRSLSASLDATSGYALGGEEITPEPAALQPPDMYDIGGTPVAAPEFIKNVIDQRGDEYALHVWGADGTVEDDDLYQRMLDVPVQGFFTQQPSKLSAFLCAQGVPRPDGSSHCTPNPDMPGLGSWEDPLEPVGPVLRVEKLRGPKKRTRAGLPAFIKVAVANSGDMAMREVRVCGKAKGKDLKVGRCLNLHHIAPGVTDKGRLRVRPKRSAKGRYVVDVTITSKRGRETSRKVPLRVKPFR